MLRSREPGNDWQQYATRGREIFVHLTGMVCPWAGNLTANFWKMSNPHPMPCLPSPAGFKLIGALPLQVQICSVFSSIKHAHDGSVVRTDYKLVQFQLQQLIWWNCKTSIRFERWLQQCFRKNQTCTIFHSQQLEDFFQNLCYFVYFRAVFIDSFSFAMKRCNNSQGFGAFFVQSCDRFLFRLNFFSHFLRSFFFFNSG